MTIEILYFGSYWEAKIENCTLLTFSLSHLLRQLKSIYGIETNLLTFNKN